MWPIAIGQCLLCAACQPCTSNPLLTGCAPKRTVTTHAHVGSKKQIKIHATAHDPCSQRHTFTPVMMILPLVNKQQRASHMPTCARGILLLLAFSVLGADSFGSFSWVAKPHIFLYLTCICILLHGGGVAQCTHASFYRKTSVSALKICQTGPRRSIHLLQWEWEGGAT